MFIHHHFGGVWEREQYITHLREEGNGGRKERGEGGKEERKRERDGEGSSKVHVRKMIGDRGRKKKGLVYWTVVTFFLPLHQLHSLPRAEALHRGEEGQEG